MKKAFPVSSGKLEEEKTLDFGDSFSEEEHLEHGQTTDRDSLSLGSVMLKP